MGMIFQFIVSAVAIFWSARYLTRATDEIARRTGLGHLFVGSIFLAASTSAPEFFVDIRATVEGIPDLAAGDLLGSSLVNLAIFAVVVIIFRPARKHMISKRATIPSALLGALLTAEVGLLIYFCPSDISFGGFHPGSFLIAITYVTGICFIFRKSSYAEADKEGMPRSPRQLTRSIALFLMGVTVIFFASPFLISSAERISQATGLENSFIGATLLALTTSFPELGTSLVAARMGLMDLVIGNILGSNAFNMIIFVFMDWIWKKPSLWCDLSSVHSASAVAVVTNMLILAVFIVLQKKTRSPLRVIGAVTILLVSLTAYALLYFMTRAG